MPRNLLFYLTMPLNDEKAILIASEVVDLSTKITAHMKHINKTND